MKVLVYGTGVIGTIYGSLLANAGHRVVHLVRPGRAAGGRRDFRIRLLDARITPPREVDSTYGAHLAEKFVPDDRYDLILVSVKHSSLPEVLTDLARGAGSADILFFNNWWDDLAMIDAALPGRYGWGFPVAGGGWIDDVLEAAVLDNVHLGGLHGHDAAHIARAMTLFESAGLRVEVEPDMLPWLWVHFATEAALISSAIAAGSIDGLLGDPGRLEEAVLTAREALEVCRARGVDVGRIPDAQTFYAPAEAVAMGIQEFYENDRAARRILERHTGVEELKGIYHDVVTTGRALEVPMPRLTALEPAVVAWSRPTVAAPTVEKHTVGAR